MLTPTRGRITLVALALAAVAGPSFGQLTKPPVTIVDARVGLPPGRYIAEREANQQAANVFKRNTWAPVYLTLEVTKEVTGNAWVVLETADDDDLRTTVTYPLGSLTGLQPGTVVRPVELPFVPYVRPSDRGGDVSISIATAKDGGSPLADPRRVPLMRSRDVGTYVVLSLGSKLPGFDLPAEEGQRVGSQTTANPGLLRGRVETAALTDVREMPDQWFGYSAADLVVLATGSAPNAFLEELFDPQKSVPHAARRDALTEWVRRGGRLVVSVGANAGLLSRYEAFNGILPVRFAAGEPSRAVAELPLSWESFGRQENKTLRSKADTFPVARLVADPARPPRVLIPRPTEGSTRTRGPETPVVVQAPFGLGRITLVAFDLDRSPFLDFADRPAFWDWVVKNAGSDRASAGAVAADEDAFAGRLLEHVNNFEGVPVVSFGWVALFIALYTLLIGPVEYMFLKKVVGRLELTWVTFPLIVLGVSVAAYYTAYALKGNDLRVNKVDVVDVDPASNRVYGRTWFTIFSPRIDTYTVGVDPRPEWAAKAGDSPRTLVDWMAGSRTGGGNLVSRGYTYHTDEAGREVADGLTGVPIQVWSTKAFAANWSAPLDAAAPLVESRLYHPPGDPTKLAGSFVNRLPMADLTDAVLIYGGKPYRVERGTLPAGEIRPVLDRSTEEPTWFAAGAGGASLREILFHERAVPRDRGLTNASLRGLDQSWRVSDRAESLYADQAVLVAKVDASGPADPLLTAADGPSPTRLWTTGLPGQGSARAAVPGTLRQETYVRAYLPVAPRPPAR
jgi:hypothetical protein